MKIYKITEASELEQTLANTTRDVVRSLRAIELTAASDDETMGVAMHRAILDLADEIERLQTVIHGKAYSTQTAAEAAKET